jgi:DNA helicase-2/ATP-dependent DNA helicase PcrA
VLDLSGLNPPQKEAVVHRGGPLLVLAGAGSGKTRVITYRIAHLIEGGVDPGHIAALTFTNKAASEMRERVGRLVGDRKAASKLTVSTFHSLGLSILKKERDALGFPRGFVIYDSADQLGVIREILRTIHIADRRFDVKAIQTRISLAKNNFERSENTSGAVGGSAPKFITPAAYSGDEADEYDEITAEVYPRYQAALRAFAAVDFDDLITEVVRLFRTDAEVAGRWRRRFRHLLVDEYQDTNRAQVHMIEALVADHGNLCVVGDDDQSIYSWRGARPKNILEFEREFPGAHVVVLDQNYRSTPSILDAANAVIANNSDRRGKVLWSDKPRGEKVIAVTAPETDSESRFVAREIDELVRGGWRHRDIAVLYRSNIQTKPLEEALRIHQVPYAMIGGQQFFERKEVKDLIAYLRVALSDRDEISLRRIINYPARGIGATTLERLGAESLARRTTLWRCVELADELDLGARQRHALNAFAELMGNLASALDERGAADAVRWLIDAVDLYGDLRAASPSLSAAQRRIDNVESFLRSLERHAERATGRDALSAYLRQLSLDTSDDKPESGDRVTLTTLHGAKGLEYPVVFLIGAEEELLPHARTLMPRATDAIDLSGEAAVDISEERRLAYVGITRAQEILYITRAETRLARGKRRVRVPSRFLLEIPEELLEHRDVADEAIQPVAADEISSFFSTMSK